jgi:hypothetical protein
MTLMLVISGHTQEQRKVYFGLMHAHTSFSDGEGTPDEAYAMAKEAGLNFFAITEHNHNQAAGDDGVFLTPDLYNKLQQSALRNTVEGEFLAIWGQEISTISTGNHQNIFFASHITDMPHGQFKYLYETWLPQHTETRIIQLNHPKGGLSGNRGKEYGIDDYDFSYPALITASDRYVKLIEVVKGSAFSTETNSVHIDGKADDDYFFYLNKGFHLAPSAGGDDHKRTWGRSMKGRLGLWATELTRAGIEEAITNLHAYASEDDNLEVQFSVNDNIMGSSLAVDGSTALRLKVTFKDPQEPEARYRVQIYYDAAVGGGTASVLENELFEPGMSEATFAHSSGPGGYYLAKVTQIDGSHADDVWTAPVWITSVADTVASSVVNEPGNTDHPEREHIEWDEASDYIGETKTVSGKVIRAHNHHDQILFFNFDPNFEQSLSLIVFQEDFEALGGAEALIERFLNKRVTVKGEITLFRQARMQIRLSHPDQIVSVQ